MDNSGKEESEKGQFWKGTILKKDNSGNRKCEKDNSEKENQKKDNS